MRVRHLLGMCALATISVSVDAELASDEFDPPSLELLEFLAQWSDEDDEMIDIEMLDVEFSDGEENVDE